MVRVDAWCALSMRAIKLALDRIMLTIIVDYLYNQHRITDMPQIKTCSRPSVVSL